MLCLRLYLSPKKIKKYSQNHRHYQHLFLKKYICTGLQSTQITNDFNSFPNPILDLTQNGLNNKMALFAASQMFNYGNKPNGYDLVNLIRECNKLGCYNFGQQLHCYVLRSGFTVNVFVSASLINFYVKFGQVNYAHKLFDEIPEPGVVSWNSLISGYVHSGQFRKALSLFLQLESSNLCSDSYSFTAALAACGQLSLLQLGKSIHSRIVKFGVESSIVVSNCLIDMYGKCESVEDAIELFNQMCCKDIISWNSVIAASARNKRLEQAFRYLYQMPNPDTISYNEVINGIAQFGNIENAIEILSTMPHPNSSSWNSILTGYVKRDRPREAIQFFSKMHLYDIEMDQFTFSSILSGVAHLASLTWGILIHCCAIKYGLDKSVVVGSALIDMYSKCGQVNTAEFFFNALPDKNLVTWNAMISGYAHNENSTKVIQLFEQLKTVKDLQPDGITFLNVLSACWHNKMPLQVATQYFDSMVNDYGIDPTVEHCSCIIRLMGQEGEVWRGERMINQLGFRSCGPVWRALLGACGISGDIKVAEVAAKKMIELEGDDEFVYVMMSNIYARYGKWGDVSAIRKLMRERRITKEAGYSWIEIENVIPASNIV